MKHFFGKNGIIALIQLLQVFCETMTLIYAMRAPDAYGQAFLRFDIYCLETPIAF